jgi:hypothetical protein
MAQKTKLYVHAASGNIMQATKKQAKTLGKAWSPIQFVENEKGERVMRFQLAGATVDVQAADVPQEVIDVDPSTD